MEKKVGRPRKTISVVTAEWLESNPEKKCNICQEVFEENDWIVKKRMAHLNCTELRDSVEVE